MQGMSRIQYKPIACAYHEEPVEILLHAIRWISTVHFATLCPPPPSHPVHRLLLGKRSVLDGLPPILPLFEIGLVHHNAIYPVDFCGFKLGILHEEGTRC